MNGKAWVFCFRPEITFFSKIWSKIKILTLSWIRVCRSQGDVYFFCFWPEIPYRQKMKTSLVLFTFFRFERTYYFWSNSVKKVNIVSLGKTFGTKTNLNMQNSMLMFPFSSVLHRERFFKQIWSKKLNCH